MILAWWRARGKSVGRNWAGLDWKSRKRGSLLDFFSKSHPGRLGGGLNDLWKKLGTWFKESHATRREGCDEKENVSIFPRGEIGKSIRPVF